jgi:hypothetical protein
LIAIKSAIIHTARRAGTCYVYFEEEPGRRSAAKLLAKDEARRIAVSVVTDRRGGSPLAKVADLMQRDL